MPRQAEVADVGVLAVGPRPDENVARLHVPVDEPGVVGGVERVRNLPDECERPLGLEPSLPAEQLSQVRALDVGHRQIEGAVLLARGENRDDVRVAQACRQFGLPQEAPAEALVAGQLRREPLEGDPLAAARVLGQVHGAHRPFADQRLDTKACDDRPTLVPGLHVRGEPRTIEVRSATSATSAHATRTQGRRAPGDRNVSSETSAVAGRPGGVMRGVEPVTGYLLLESLTDVSPRPPPPSRRSTPAWRVRRRS